MQSSNTNDNDIPLWILVNSIFYIEIQSMFVFTINSVKQNDQSGLDDMSSKSMTTTVKFILFLSMFCHQSIEGKSSNWNNSCSFKVDGNKFQSLSYQ